MVVAVAFTPLGSVGTQNYTTSTQLITSSSTATVQVVVSNATNTEFVGGPNVVDGCPWIEVQSSPGEFVRINFVAVEGTTVDFYIVGYADYYPYGTDCRPLPTNPLLAEKGIHSFNEEWTPPRPGKYYLIWRNAEGQAMMPFIATCTNCGMDIQFSYSIVNSTTQVVIATMTSLVVTSKSNETSVQETYSQSSMPFNLETIGILAMIVGLVVVALVIRSRNQMQKGDK